MKEKKKIRIALVGSDSLRGKEIKKALSKKRFPLEDIDFFDPDVKEEYSKLTQFRGEPKVIHYLEKNSLQNADLVFLAADKKVNREFGILANKQNFHAIDLSGAFNTDKSIPVVVAGVNDGIIDKKKPGIIANPHPATVVLSHIFHAVIEMLGLSKAISFILQPVSAYEESGIQELANQSYCLLSSEPLSKKVFSEQIAFNLLSQTEKPDKNGFSSVERQISSEIQRILPGHDFFFSLSIIQAPVFFTYSIMTYLELKKKTDIQGLKNIFKEHSLFHLSPPDKSGPISVAGKEKISIGQIKREKSLPNSFWIWTVADNLILGSALNAFEIAEKIIFKPES
jgi:aspartate-semialdehyde dehydrogenase